MEHKASRRKKIVQLTAEINKLEKNKDQKINETKNWNFEKIKQVDKLLAILTEKEKDSNKPNQMKGINHNTTKILGLLGITMDIFLMKLMSLEEVNTFLAFGALITVNPEPR